MRRVKSDVFNQMSAMANSECVCDGHGHFVLKKEHKIVFHSQVATNAGPHIQCYSGKLSSDSTILFKK